MGEITNVNAEMDKLLKYLINKHSNYSTYV